MHLQPRRSSEAKAEIVRESLRRVGRLDADVVEDLVRIGAAVEPFGYRTTIRVVGGPDGTLGYREERSERVVPITSCPIAESHCPGCCKIELDEGARSRCGRVSPPVRSRPSGRGSIARRPGLPAVHIGERAWFSERIAGVDLRVSAGSFFQSGAQGAELFVDAVGRAAPELATRPTPSTPTAGSACSRRRDGDAGHVTVIESSKSACFDAEHNLADRSATIVKSEVGRWQPADRPVDVVVADPARSGLGKPGVTCSPPAAPVFVLVSCDPVSLARDMTLMAQRRVRPESVEVLDLFPNTPHVETVTRSSSG